MEMLSPEEMPQSLVEKFSRRDIGTTDNTLEHHEQYDTLHRIVARVKTGSFVGNLAVGVALRPQTVNHLVTGYGREKRLVNRVATARYPKKELTSELIHEAGAAHAHRIEAAGSINAIGTNHQRQ